MEKYKYYITRDKSGLVSLWHFLPKKDYKAWTGFGFIGHPFKECFPEVKWEDEEPTEVEITIKEK